MSVKARTKFYLGVLLLIVGMLLLIAIQLGVFPEVLSLLVAVAGITVLMEV
jgi:hypothetical protein